MSLFRATKLTKPSLGLRYFISTSIIFLIVQTSKRSLAPALYMTRKIGILDSFQAKIFQTKAKMNDFPATLEGFGYHFNENGQLRSIEENIPFRFEVREGDKEYNQAHYEALGKAVECHIYDLLVHEEDLKKVIIPLDGIENEPTSFIFMSKNVKDYHKLLILIHGSGVVRAGQWTRNLIINKSLESGSQIPYIQKAKQEKYGIVILNTNQNEDIVTGEGTVRGSESPEEHFLYVWDKIIVPSGVPHIAIMAHSYGGQVVLNTALKRIGEFKERVFAIAMSDSIHGIQRLGGATSERSVKKVFKETARNWVSSMLPLDCHVESGNPIDSNRVSAGTRDHIKTSWYAFSSVFQFFQRQWDHRLSELQRTNRDPVTRDNSVPHPVSQSGETSEVNSVCGGEGVEERTKMACPNIKEPVEHDEKKTKILLRDEM